MREEPTVVEKGVGLLHQTEVDRDCGKGIALCEQAMIHCKSCVEKVCSHHVCALKKEMKLEADVQRSNRI